MRLLLLLSAILSALTGVAGARAAVAQPVAATVPAAAQVEQAHAGVVAVAELLSPASWYRVGLGAVPAIVAVEPAAAYPLYADRRRE